MFEPKKKKFTVDGAEIELRELSAEEFFNLPDDPFEVVAMAWVSPGRVTKEEVSKWPGSIVMQISEFITEMNDISGNSLSETLRTTE